jgi:hypothetical protein
LSQRHSTGRVFNKDSFLFPPPFFLELLSSCPHRENQNSDGNRLSMISLIGCSLAKRFNVSLGCLVAIFLQRQQQRVFRLILLFTKAPLGEGGVL